MINLDQIKARQSPVTTDEYTNFVEHAFGDIADLIREVERLDRALELCEVGLTPSDVDEGPDDPQSCCHSQEAAPFAADEWKKSLADPQEKK